MEKEPGFYRSIWEHKPVLREIYADIYRRIIAQTINGPILEVGGGSGNFKTFAPDTISVDIISAPWLDLVCDAQRLPFADNSFSNIVMVDVLHHIESPLRFLEETQRVLKTDGRLIFCEPAITPLSGIFYRLFHEEPVDMSVNPLAVITIDANKDPWDSNQAIPTLLTGRYRNSLSAAIPKLMLTKLDLFSFVAYPLSGGFQKWCLVPYFLVKQLLKFEHLVQHLFGRLAAFRMLAVYRKIA